MDKVKSILNPGFKESDALLYDVGDSKKKGGPADQVTQGTEQSTATADPVAAKDFQAGHQRFDSGVEANQAYNQPAAAEYQKPIAEESYAQRDATLGTGAAPAATVSRHDHAQNTGIPPSQQYDQYSQHDQYGQYGQSALPPQGVQGGLYQPPVAAGEAPVQSSVPGQNEHHYGRDAAVGAGAVGAAEAVHAHHKHEEEEEAVDEGNTRKPSILKRIFKRGDKDEAESTVTHKDGKLHKKHSGHEATHYDHADPAATQTTADNTVPPTQQDHHYGRDAALGAGAAGVGAAALHHHEKREAEQTYPQNPNVRPAAATRMEARGPTTAQDYPAQQPTTANEPVRDHHYGRDAAIGAGAAGVGAAAYHHHHEQRESEQPYSQNPNAAQTAATGMQARDPTTTQDYRAEQPAAVSEPVRDHHYGRDAAVGAGAVGATEAAHEHHRHHEHEKDAVVTEHTEKEKKPSILKRIFKRGDKDTDTAEEPTEAEHDHHYGRDAALGAGAAGVGAAALHHHNEKKEEKEELAAPADQQLHTQPEQKKEHGIVSQILNPGGHKADDVRYGSAATEVPAESRNQTHTTDPAAVGVPAEQKLQTKPEKKKEHNILKQIFNPGNDKADSTRYGSTATAVDPASQADTGRDYHIGRDAALGAGAVGAGGFAAHEYNEYNKHKTEAAAVPESHLSRDAALGIGTTGAAAGVAAHEHNKHQTEAAAVPESHLGRDAALGAGAAGAAGAAGYAAHEHNKHKTEAAAAAPERTPYGNVEPTPTPAAGYTPSNTSRAAREELPEIEDDGGRFMNTSDLSKGTSAAGSGMAVAAAQKAYKDHEATNADDTPISPTSTSSISSGPASKTQGPHKSNILNILDPRVRPDFQQMKANKDAKNMTDTTEASPAAVAAADTATKSTSHNDTLESSAPQSSFQESHIPQSSVPESSAPVSNAPVSTAPLNKAPVNSAPANDIPASNAPVSSTTGTASEAKRVPTNHTGIVTGEKGVIGDSGNPYSSSPLDPRVTMPGTYPTGTPSAE